MSISFRSRPINHYSPSAKSTKSQLRIALDLQDTVLIRTWKCDQINYQGGGGVSCRMDPNDKSPTIHDFPGTNDKFHTIRKFRPHRKRKTSIVRSRKNYWFRLNIDWLSSARNTYLWLFLRIPTWVRCFLLASRSCRKLKMLQLTISPRLLLSTTSCCCCCYISQNASSHAARPTAMQARFPS